MSANETSPPMTFAPVLPEAFKAIVEAMSPLHDELLKLPASRERSLAFTKLDECMHWARDAAERYMAPVAAT